MTLLMADTERKLEEHLDKAVKKKPTKRNVRENTGYYPPHQKKKHKTKRI